MSFVTNYHQADEEILTQIIRTTCVEYHQRLKDNLPTNSASWTYTSREWKIALLKTRDEIRSYCQENLHWSSLWLEAWRRYFIKYPHLINKGDQDHKLTPLMLAVIFQHTGFAATLLELGADVHLETEEGESAITFAKHYESEEIVSLLLPEIAKVEKISAWDLS